MFILLVHLIICPVTKKKAESNVFVYLQTFFEDCHTLAVGNLGYLSAPILSIFEVNEILIRSQLMVE